MGGGVVIVPLLVLGLPGGFALMYLAGVLSGLLGIGSGAMKVPAMDRVMKVPFKVSTTTSNLMIGVTAAASAGVYLNRGYIDPVLAMPIVLGVLAGSLLGARLLSRTPTTCYSFTLAQLRFASIRMTSFRSDLHLQDSAHAGRTKERHST